jgi:hypothetical protein
VGSWPDRGGGGAPLMATGYEKRGRRRWPIKEGEGERARPLDFWPWRQGGRWLSAVWRCAEDGGDTWPT